MPLYGVHTTCACSGAVEHGHNRGLCIVIACSRCVANFGSDVRGRIGEEAHDVELRVRRGVEEDPAGYDWTSMGRIRVPADRADLVGCLPQRRFGPPWRPPWLTLVTAYFRRREQAFYNFTYPILQFRID